jgi:DNA adenine methylase
MFIYLNKTSFNGIWRVNQSGKFNVPFGNKLNIQIPSLKYIQSISKRLWKMKIKTQSYKEILNEVNKNDFIYLDPPYPPLNGTSYFTHYTREKFNLEDQKEVADFASKLNKNGCFLLISNADTPYIRNLYKDEFCIEPLDVIRWIRSDGKRYKVRELIISNYN